MVFDTEEFFVTVDFQYDMAGKLAKRMVCWRFVAKSYIVCSQMGG